MCKIKAKAKFHDQELTDIPVINPGDWWGKTWLLEVGGSYTPLFLVVEADSVQSAIDELSENDKYAHLICVSDSDLGDYDPNDCNYGPSGQVWDLDWLQIYGQEGSDCPFPCRYFGDGLPEDGMVPTDYHDRDED